jgi:RNA polymerase sigma factor (sigma-70 family)
MNDAQRFEELVLPQLAAAYNIARWLTRSDSAAQDVVQESCVRALGAVARFAGGNARAWLLAIVRHESYRWLKQRAGERWVGLDDETALGEDGEARLSHWETPEDFVSRTQDQARLTRALETLPAPYREVIVLRDLEDMSYKEVAQVTGVPLGTVMSRLARGRELLRRTLVAGDE